MPGESPERPHPTAEIEDALWVKLSIPQPDAPGRLHMDDGTCRALLDWIIAEDVPTIRGGAQGPGFAVWMFYAEDAPRVRQWLADHNVEEERRD